LVMLNELPIKELGNYSLPYHITIVVHIKYLVNIFS